MLGSLRPSTPEAQERVLGCICEVHAIACEMLACKLACRLFCLLVCKHSKHDTREVMMCDASKVHHDYDGMYDANGCWVAMM